VLETNTSVRHTLSMFGRYLTWYGCPSWLDCPARFKIQTTLRSSISTWTDSRRIVCFFDLDLERNAFVSLPAKFTFLNNDLRGSRRDVLSCVLQLEHMQLIGGGVEVSDGGKKGWVICIYTLLLADHSLVDLKSFLQKNSLTRTG
jgi:hypothetical protein